MPVPLERFYAQIAKWPRVMSQNRVLLPPELRTEDSKLVFYVENQSVYFWATSESGNDAPVWIRENRHVGRWELEAEPLSVFLLQLVLFEAAMGAPDVATAMDLPGPEMASIIRRMTKAPFGPWRTPQFPTEFYLAPGAVAFVSPAGSGRKGYYLFVGAKDPSALVFLEPFVDDSWEHYSPRDGPL